MKLGAFIQAYTHSGTCLLLYCLFTNTVIISYYCRKYCLYNLPFPATHPPNRMDCKTFQEKRKSTRPKPNLNPTPTRPQPDPNPNPTSTQPQPQPQPQPIPNPTQPQPNSSVALQTQLVNICFDKLFCFTIKHLYFISFVHSCQVILVCTL